MDGPVRNKDDSWGSNRSKGEIGGKKVKTEIQVSEFQIDHINVCTRLCSVRQSAVAVKTP